MSVIEVINVPIVKISVFIMLGEMVPKSSWLSLPPH
jgi:hypothetical protein